MAARRLSLCMITKNEATMLPAMLASVDGLWDELIVADTGSTDGTVALLEKHGATIVHHQWNDDFAAARNASLEAASGDWILFLDADERASAELCGEISALLADEVAGAATVLMLNELPAGDYRTARLLRLFRNDPAIRFRHKIHEDVLQDVEEFLDRECLVLRDLRGSVEHLGYVREVAAERNKRQRDQSLLRQVLQDDPRDFYCWFKLLESARFWDDAALWKSVAAEVEPIFMGTLSTREQRSLRRNSWSGELAAMISRGLAGSPADALTWLQQAEDRVYPAAAYFLQVGLWLEILDRKPEARIALNLCGDDTRPAAQHHWVRANLAISRLAAADGDFAQAKHMAQQALIMAPHDDEAILALVGFSQLGDKTWDFPAFMQQQLAQHPATAEVWARQLVTTGKLEIAAEVLKEHTLRDPALAMGRLVCTLALGEDFELEVELSAEKAETAFRRWVHVLWCSRQTGAMEKFADNCGAVLEVFPWLTDFLVAETQALKNSSSN